MKNNSGVKEVETETMVSMGDMVIFGLTNEEFRPAIVVRVIDEDTVDVHVFLASDYDLQFVANGLRTVDPSETNVGLAYRPMVKRGTGSGKWNYKHP